MALSPASSRGGGGTVTGVTAADTSIVVGGTAVAPTIATGTLDVIATDHPPAADWSNNAKKITAVADPGAAQDAATKNYVDAVALGLTYKAPADLGTVAVLPANVYANGASGVGATLTASANGALSVDGTAVAVGQRVLVKNEATTSHNGIYTVTATGGAGASYVLTRATDFNQASQIKAGDALFVTGGGTLSDTLWVQTTTGAIVVGTTAVVFSQLGVTPSLASVLAVGNSAASGKIVSLANGTAASDAAAFGQIPVTLPIQGFASGILVPAFPSTNNTNAAIASRAVGLRFLCLESQVITKIALVTAVAATNNDNCDVGIFSADGTTLLASSGSTAGKMNATAGVQTLTLSSSASLVAGTVYYAAFAYGTVGGTAATLVQTNSPSGLPTLMGATLPNAMQPFQGGAFPLAAPLVSAGTTFAVPVLGLLR